jgi:hypothetical protein
MGGRENTRVLHLLGYVCEHKSEYPVHDEEDYDCGEADHARQ